MDHLRLERVTENENLPAENEKLPAKFEKIPGRSGNFPANGVNAGCLGSGRKEK